MVLLDKIKDNAAFLKFLEKNGIKPVRPELKTTLFGPCSIVLEEEDAERVRAWLNEKGISFIELPIQIEQG